MIGLAEIQDMLSEFSEAQAEADGRRSSAIDTGAADRWSWGHGPTVLMEATEDLDSAVSRHAGSTVAGPLSEKQSG